MLNASFRSQSGPPEMSSRSLAAAHDMPYAKVTKRKTVVPVLVRRPAVGSSPPVHGPNWSPPGSFWRSTGWIDTTSKGVAISHVLS